MDWATLRGRNLGRLRQIVKRVHLKHYPGEHITDREADRVIDAMAPDVAEKLVRAFVDRKVGFAADVELATAVAEGYTRT